MAVEKGNEITLKIECKLEKFYKIIEKKGFKGIEKFSLDDTYFIRKDLEIEKMSTREILANAVLVRIVDRMPQKIVKNITFKRKEYDEKGNITYQDKVECDIINEEDAKKLLSSIGYKEIMRIKEDDLVYMKDNFQFSVKNIENGDKLIEIEEEYNKEGFDSIESLKQTIIKYELPVDINNLFIKKAEVELNKILNR